MKPVASRRSPVASSESSDETVPVARVPLDVRSTALAVLAVIAVVLVLHYAQAMLIPIVLGVLISYALDPIVGAMARLRIPRALGAAILLGALASGGAVLAYHLRAEAIEIADQLPKAARRMRERLETDRTRPPSAMEQVQKAAAELAKVAGTTEPPPPPGVQRVQVEAPAFNVGDYVMTGSLGLITAAGQALLVGFLVFFLLASGDLYRRKLVKIAGPSLTKKKVTLQILSEIDRQIEVFLLVQVFTSTVVAVATWLAFRWLGLQQAAVWGLLAGVFNSIPYFGPVVVAGGTTTVAFLQFDNVRMALAIGGISLVITTLEGFFLTPWLTSRAARMNAVAVFVNLLFWAWIWDGWGMLLAVPMLMVVKVVCDHIEDFRPIGELIGE